VLLMVVPRRLLAAAALDGVLLPSERAGCLRAQDGMRSSGFVPCTRQKRTISEQLAAPGTFLLLHLSLHGLLKFTGCLCLQPTRQLRLLSQTRHWLLVQTLDSNPWLRLLTGMPLLLLLPSMLLTGTRALAMPALGPALAGGCHTSGSLSCLCKVHEKGHVRQHLSTCKLLQTHVLVAISCSGGQKDPRASSCAVLLLLLLHLLPWLAAAAAAVLHRLQMLLLLPCSRHPCLQEFC
jgi:hypothetical protein